MFWIFAIIGTIVIGGFSYYLIMKDKNKAMGPIVPGENQPPQE